MSDLSQLMSYTRFLLDGTTRNTKDSLDFLEGFVYALILVQDRIKEINGEENKARENQSRS